VEQSIAIQHVASAARGYQLAAKVGRKVEAVIAMTGVCGFFDEVDFLDDMLLPLVGC
jgi:hypothetical protein